MGQRGRRRQGRRLPNDFAKAQAEPWTKGLADWGQDRARIQGLLEAVDFPVFTPGSDAESVGARRVQAAGRPVQPRGHPRQ